MADRVLWKKLSGTQVPRVDQLLILLSLQPANLYPVLPPTSEVLAEQHGWDIQWFWWYVILPAGEASSNKLCFILLEDRIFTYHFFKRFVLTITISDLSRDNELPDLPQPSCTWIILPSQSGEPPSYSTGRRAKDRAPGMGGGNNILSDQAIGSRYQLLINLVTKPH